jgi:Na+-driven multidrug efflux pump
MIFTLIALWVVRVPLALLLSHTGLGLIGVWISFAVGFATAMTISLFYYRSGRWRTVVTRSPAAAAR